MMSLIVLIRGMSTERIREDAVRRGLIVEGASVAIVASADDPIAQAGDLTPDALMATIARLLIGGPLAVTLVANGGPTLGTAVALRLQRMEHDQRLLYCAGATRHMFAAELDYKSTVMLRVVDLQRDRLVELA